MIYGILDISTGDFTYVSAGHPGPVHLPFGGSPVILPSDGFPIGLGEDADEERKVHLEPGDRLFLYSDGLPEAMDSSSMAFGEPRLLEAVEAGRSEPIKQSAERLMAEVNAWNGPRHVADDMSVLAFEISPRSE
jgi:sigma-B regulation protein RsbU (phosphoserine phosphatase)